MTFYCNDCGCAFDPDYDQRRHPDGVGRCRGCIHESGDCSPSQVPCALCRAAHDQGHRNDEPSPYCQVCRTKADDAKMAAISPRLSRLLHIGQPLLDQYNEEKMR